jgi:hypothetical protein
MMGLEVEIVDNTLECWVDGKLLWFTPIPAIVLIAEYNTNQGYWGDDSYVLIKSFERDKLLHVRIHDSVIGGHGVLLRALGEQLGAELDLKLPYEAAWNSRVMWPEAIKDEKLFTLDPIVPTDIWGRLRERWFGGQLSLAVTQPVQEYLKKYRTYS